MQLSERDAACLSDMLEAAVTISDYIQGVTLPQYLSDRKLQLAIERLTEIIGEAARGVSNECKNRHPDVPWSGMIAQRHVLAHDYGAVKQERIWLVATQGVPELIALVKPLIPKATV